MNAIDRTFLRVLAIAMLAGACLAGTSFARAQRATQDTGASMVQPPQSPASGVNPHNPHTRPVKRPSNPTNDPIARPPPASATHAK